MKRIFMRGNPGDFANYVAALTACGAEPVISMTLSDADTCDGLLIPGGADVNPVLYGQENTASKGIDDTVMQTRSRLQNAFLQRASRYSAFAEGIRC